MSYLQQVGCTAGTPGSVCRLPWCLLGSTSGASVAFPEAIQSPRCESGRGGLQSMLRAPQSLGLRGTKQSCAKASDEMWLLAGGSCSCSSFERSWERRPKTTTGESVQMKGLVSVRVPSAVFSGSSVISCHFGIWAYWTSASMD